MKAIAAVRAMRYLYNFRKALSKDDRKEILRSHALYSEWQVRVEEFPTARFAKDSVCKYLDTFNW